MLYPAHATTGVRIRSFGFHFPGERVALRDLPLTDQEAKRLPKLGQEFSYIAEEDSTALMVCAAKDALDKCGLAPADIGLVISAPSLLTSYGLEIPAVAVRAALGLQQAQCLNVAQGCAGVLRGMDLAALMLASSATLTNVLVVTSCRASPLTRHLNHGAFFWGDAAAAVVLTAAPGPGLTLMGYAEASADADWGAMRVAVGDALPIDGWVRPDPEQLQSLIDVQFADAAGQLEYIRGEQVRFATVFDTLLAARGLHQQDIDALFLPSTGKNRLPILFQEHKGASEKVATDFRYAHLGGVDPILSISQYLENGPPADGSWSMALSPAFAAQWSGLLFRYDSH